MSNYFFVNFLGTKSVKDVESLLKRIDFCDGSILPEKDGWIAFTTNLISYDPENIAEHNKGTLLIYSFGADIGYHSVYYCEKPILSYP